MFESIGQPSSAPQAPKPPVTPLEIHTMPERFLGASTKTGGPTPAPKKGNKKLILAVGIIIVVLLGAGAAIMFTGVLNRNSANTNTTNLVTNTPTTNVNSNSNANANRNTNGNSNANANGNANINSNGNSNTNANGNVNSNANGNANSNVNSNPLAASSIDTDKDGLTDAEESVFSTNPSSQDSDGDGFLDGSEVKLGYNPKGSGKLNTSTLMSTFTNGLYGASVLYPRSWVSVARTTTEQLFTSPAGDETISMSVQDNVARLTAKQWYIQQAPSVDATTITDVQTWDKLSTGIMSPDGNAYYFANGSQVFLFSLSFGAKPSVDSRTTLEMVARSLVVDPTKVNLNTNTNTANTNTANANTNASNANVNTNSNSNLNSSL